MNYSLRSFDAGGRAQQTAVALFQDDAAALRQARSNVCDAAVVEVWNGDRLIAKLFRDPPYAEGSI